MPREYAFVEGFPTRVRVTRNAFVAMLDLVAANGHAVVAKPRMPPTAGRQLAGTALALDYKRSSQARTIAFQGYAYTRTPSDISAAW